MFGPHLIIDGSRCDTRKLADRILVEQVLNDYPAAIGMTKIGGPYMFEYQAPDPAYSGVSGLVVIAESHIAIHTFPELDYFTMDIFSCKNFDHEKAIEYIRDARSTWRRWTACSCSAASRSKGRTTASTARPMS